VLKKFSDQMAGEGDNEKDFTDIIGKRADEKVF
jgi:hypothetical protein